MLDLEMVCGKPSVCGAALAAWLVLGGCAAAETAGDGGRADVGSCSCDAGLGPCDPDRVVAAGTCANSLGFRWTGSSCEELTGCTCRGPECDELPATYEACIAPHPSCTRRCALGSLECLPGEFCSGDVCLPSNPFGVASAARDCAPADGPAWRFVLSASRESCEVEPAAERLVITVWHALETAAPAVTYTLQADLTGDGQAFSCSGRAGEPCEPVTGAISFQSFDQDVAARFDVELLTESGRRISQRDIEIGAWWCGSDPAGCG